MSVNRLAVLNSGSQQRAELIADIERKFSRKAILQRRFGRLLADLQLLWINSISGLKRLTDLSISGFLLAILAPLILGLYLRNRTSGGSVLRTRRFGRWGCYFDELSFSGGPMRPLLSLVNVWRGDMSIIGPRAVEPGEFAANERLLWRRLNLRPGLLCLWWLRKRANIAYGTELNADSEYLDTQSFRCDLGIALRAIPASFYGDQPAVAGDRIDLLGIPVDNVTMEEAVERIVQLGKWGRPSQVCFVNADCANIAARDSEYNRILQSAQLVLADGIGVKLAGKILNRNIRQT